MITAKEILKESKKIVVKVGSNVLSTESGNINKEAMANIVSQVVTLREMGKHVTIVSSGAGICGVGAINKWARRNDMNYKQALCAIGQVELMIAYKEIFGSYDINVAQMLLTREDFSEGHRNLNIRNLLFTLVDEGVVPIVNENDSVSIDEIKIGDNDTLAARTANIWNADSLVMLSDIDGVYDKNPKENKDAKLIESVKNLKTIESEINISGKSDFGTGGLVTKIQAARIVEEYGIHAILLNGNIDGVMLKVIDGEESGTVFC